MDLGISTFFKKYLMNTVLAIPPPCDCPPPPPKKRCAIQNKHPEPEAWPPGDGFGVPCTVPQPPQPPQPLQPQQPPAQSPPAQPPQQCPPPPPSPPAGRKKCRPGEYSGGPGGLGGGYGEGYCEKGSYGGPGSGGYLGKTGAGVTGSRCRIDGKQGALDDQGEFLLPNGATNPGLLRHIHNASRYRLPQCFEGGILSVKQKVQRNWVLGHSVMFSSVSPGGYKVLLSYMNKDRPTGLPYFVLETAPGGQVSCEARVAPSSGSRATLMTQFADAEFRSFESIMDFYFYSSTASVIAVNREFIALHFLQAVTDQLSLGAELVARGQFLEMSSASVAARWATDDYAFSGTIGNRGLDLCCAKVVKPFLTVAALLEMGFATQRSVATLAYEWTASNWTFRASADSDLLVGATLQKALGGTRANLACAISALLNHPNNKFRLGFGVSAAII